MCRYEDIRLPPNPPSARAARQWVTHLVDHWNLAEIADDLRLVVSELVSNAVLHARTELEVAMSVGEGILELVVRDHNPRSPRPRPRRPDENATGGRGLMLVEQLSDDWGVAERMDGKAVWYRVAAPKGWRPPDPCACGGDTDEGVRLTASGQRIACPAAAG